jgi:hypothetical protein
VVFCNTTIRQTVRLSIGTEKLLRIRLSNAFGLGPLTITQTTLALATNNESGTTGIQPQTLTSVSFDGNESTTIPAGAQIVSDAVNFGFPLQSNTVLSISIFLEAGQNARCVTTHPGSRTTSYFTKGNRVSERDFNHLAVQQTDHWWVKVALCSSLCKAANSDIGTISVGLKFLHHEMRELLRSSATASRTVDAALRMATLGMLMLLNQCI